MRIKEYRRQSSIKKEKWVPTKHLKCQKKKVLFLAFADQLGFKLGRPLVLRQPAAPSLHPQVTWSLGIRDGNSA